MAYKTNGRYDLLDSFRGLAILWIVCFHILRGVREDYGNVLNFLISNGYLGVSIFFVIGGYGIAESVKSREIYFSAPLLFLQQRLRRIYLCYWWHLLFAVLIIPFCTNLVSTLKGHPFSMNFDQYSLLEWAQVVTLTKVFSANSWDLQIAFLPLNGVVWYIAIVVQIYMFITIGLYLKKQFELFMVIGFLGSIFSFSPTIKTIIPYGFFLPYFSQFYVGYVLHYLLQKKLIPKTKLFIGLFLTTLTAVCLVCYIKESSFLPLSFAIAISYVFLIGKKYDLILQRWFIVRLFGLIGLFSYSLYLLHIPLWPFIDMFIRYLTPFSFQVNGPFVVIPLIILLSFLWYVFFEKPNSFIKTCKSILSPVNTFMAELMFAKKRLERPVTSFE